METQQKFNSSYYGPEKLPGVSRNGPQVYKSLQANLLLPWTGIPSTGE